MKKRFLTLALVAAATLTPVRSLAASYTVQTDLFNSVVINLFSAALLEGFIVFPDISVEKAVKDNVGVKVDLLLSTDLSTQWLEAEALWYPGRKDIGGPYLGGGLFGIHNDEGRLTTGLKGEAGYKWITDMGLTLGVCYAAYYQLSGPATGSPPLARPGLTVGWSW